ncbi:MAG: 16S rRNA (uracil(1498)-N(3))-methyltransferase [Aquabacterium sp.]
MPRFHIGDDLSLRSGLQCGLPEGAARHVQVLRMQPGGQVQLFDGAGHEWLATVTEMGRKSVSVEIGEAVGPPAQELPVRVTLAMGMPANDRMDALVEKATELGVHAIQPLMCERSVLRLDGERAAKKVAHWQAVAVSACEQSGRAWVPRIHEVRTLQGWLKEQADAAADHALHRGVLSLREAISMKAWLDRRHGVEGTGLGDACAARADQFVFLSGPEGGLAPAEEQSAIELGWTAITLGPRVLRADTAPLAALSVIACAHEG